MLPIMATTTSGSRHVPSPRGKKIKLAILGDKQVGKTSLISRLVHDSFCHHYTYTQGGDIQNVDITINDSRVRVTIVDAAGHRFVRTLIRSLYRDVQGIMIVFDVTRETTFVSIQEWLAQIEMVNPNAPVIFLVGNKQDLSSHRCVQQEQAEFQSLRMDLQYFETSAKSGYNVRESFTELLRAVWHNKTPSMRALYPSNDIIKISSSDSEELSKGEDSCCSTS